MRIVTKILIFNFIFSTIGFWIGHFINGSNIKFSIAITFGMLAMTIISIINFKIRNIDVKEV